MKKVKAVKVTPVFQTSQIRLSVDETRNVIKVAAGKTDNLYGCSGLVDMGIMRAVPAAVPDVKKAVNTAWLALEHAVTTRDIPALDAANKTLQRLSAPPRRDVTYVLTPLGKALARGITVRLNAQGKEQ
jgi:hypothetical protein